MDMHLAGKTALICGGSSGIGLACAHAFAEEGAAVVIVARDPARLEQARTALAVHPVPVTAIATDLSVPAAAQTLRAQIEALDIIVASPGGSPSADIMEPGAWVPGIEQIVAAPIAIFEAFLPGMTERRFGRIINLTSSGVAFANPALAFSGALRAALTHAATNLARRVAPYGITVNSIAPGPVTSNGLEEFFARVARQDGLSVEQVRAARLATIPAARFAEAEEIGRMAVFLASPHARSITGRTMLMDGGANPFPFL